MDDAGEADRSDRKPDRTNDEVASDAAKGPRAAVVLLIAAVVLAVLVGGAVVIDRFVLDDGDAEIASAPSATEDDVIDVEPVQASATRLFTRVTDDEVEVRVNASDDDMMFGGGFPFNDDAPEWCVLDGTVSATALTVDSIAQAQLPRTKEAPPTAGLTMGIGGLVEEAPIAVVVAQVGDDVRQVRLRHASGANDTMEPVDGIVALAVSFPMPENQNGGFDPFGGVSQAVTLEVLRDDGQTDTFSRDDFWSGIPLWNDPVCMQAQGMPVATEAPAVADLELPDAGPVQPLDPAVERGLIERSLTDLFENLWAKDTLFTLVDDASGIDIIMRDLMGQFGRKFREMEPEIVDLVFFSPIEASFTYTSGFDPFGDGFIGAQPAYGRARLIDGVWRITRSTVCQELAKAGAGCTI